MLRLLIREKKAIEYTLKALNIKNDNLDLMNNLGLFYYHDDQIENSLRTLKKALSTSPAHRGVVENYKMILDDSEAIARAGIVLEDLEKKYQ